MGTLIFRVKRRLRGLVNDFHDDRRFSQKLAWCRLLCSLTGMARLKRLSMYFNARKERFILSYVEESVSEAIQTHQNADDPGTKVENAPIWVCWWSGLDTAPPLVQQCVNSIIKQANGHPVNIITDKSVSRFIDIPAFMMEKVNRGHMGLAHLADYIRVSLLHQFGGLWLDATIFCTNAVPAWFFEIPVFTCKSEYRESGYLSHYQWTTFCLGGWKENVFYAFLKDAFEQYWSQNDFAIDYLFFDDLIYLAKKHIKAVRDFLDAVPINTEHRDDLQAAMNAALPASEFDHVIQSDTPIYKLSWRETYSETTKDGGESVYGYFLRLSQEDEA